MKIETVKNRDDHLLKDIARRNWIIFAGLLGISLFWQNPSVTYGVAAGGAIAIAGFHWLHRSLKKTLLDHGVPGTPQRFRFGYLIRLLTLGASLAFFIAVIKVHPLGLVAGLSVVVLNIFWTTFRRTF